MDRVWESNAISTVPATPSPLSHGYPTEGDLGTSVPPTNPGAWWYHMITQELMAVILAANITPSGTTLNQLLAALDARYTPTAVDLTGVVRLTDFNGSNQSLANSGYQSLPGGLLIQWTTGLVDGANGTPVTWPISFPSACFGAISTSNDTFLPTTPIGVISPTTTGCVLDCESSSDTPSAFVIAIGH